MARRLENAMLMTLHALCKERNLRLEEKAPGHFQIRGQLLVNYYPFSKKRTAYVAGTTTGKHEVDPLMAVTMADTAPPLAKSHEKDKRSKLTRETRRWLMEKRKIKNCRWCNCKLSIDTSTLEHIIPLARGGLNDRNNMTLACKPCNLARGHDMPELEVIVPVSAVPEAVVMLPVAEKPALLMPKPAVVEPEYSQYLEEPVVAEKPQTLHELLDTLSNLPDQERKLVLELKHVELQGQYSAAQLKASRYTRADRLKRAKHNLEAQDALSQLQIVKAHITSLNAELAKEREEVHARRFRTVAKDLLAPDVFKALQEEFDRRNPEMKTERGSKHVV